MVTVQHDDGSCLNYNIDELVNPPARVSKASEQTIYNPTNVGLRIAGMAYQFEREAILQEHSHDINSLHTIECVSGSVIVHKDSGDVMLRAGEIATIMIDEKHSVKALEPSKTVHWKV